MDCWVGDFGARYFGDGDAVAEANADAATVTAVSYAVTTDAAINCLG